MKKYFPTLLLCLIPAACFGQTNLQITRMDGTTEVIRVQTFDTTPRTIPIRPYGLNLKPANIPARNTPASSVTFNPSPYNPGPAKIVNPYFVEQAEPTSGGGLGYFLVLLIKRIFRLP